MTDVRNRNEIRIFGIRRSGNHAISHWVMDHFEGVIVNLNDINSKSVDPYSSFRSVVVRGVSRRLCKRKVMGVNRYTAFGGEFEDERLHFRQVDYEALRRAKKDLLVLGYENEQLDNAVVQKFLDQAESLVGRSAAVRNAILLRDPYNHFASLIRSKMMGPRGYGYYRRMWLQYARDIAGKKNYFRSNFVFINYNKWVVDKLYKKRTAEQLGFETDGSLYSRVPSYGGGSSFQGAGGDATSLQVGTRWEAYRDDEGFRGLFDAEVVELAEAIFGMENPL